MRRLTLRRHTTTALQLYRPPEDVAPVEYITLPRVDDVPTVTHEIRRPLRSSTTESDVAVPVLQAAFTALAGLLCGLIVGLHFGWTARGILGVGALTLLGAWLWRIRASDALLWQIETFTGRDLNGDGVRGQPRPILVNPLQAQAEARTALLSDEQEALLVFLRRCYSRGCSEKSHGVTATGPGRTAYVKNRDALLGLGVARWKHEHHRDGWELAVPYDAAVRLLRGHTL